MTAGSLRFGDPDGCDVLSTSKKAALNYLQAAGDIANLKRDAGQKSGL
jgi:hypothetical protein